MNWGRSTYAEKVDACIVMLKRLRQNIDIFAGMDLTVEKLDAFEMRKMGTVKKCAIFLFATNQAKFTQSHAPSPVFLEAEKEGQIRMSLTYPGYQEHT